jgi:hypothetical protein
MKLPIRNKERACVCCSVVDSLPHVHESLGVTPSTAQKEKV